MVHFSRPVLTNHQSVMSHRRLHSTLLHLALPPHQATSVRAALRQCFSRLPELNYTISPGLSVQLRCVCCWTVAASSPISQKKLGECQHWNQLERSKLSIATFESTTDSPQNYPIVEVRMKLNHSSPLGMLLYVVQQYVSLLSANLCLFVHLSTPTKGHCNWG